MVLDLATHDLVLTLPCLEPAAQFLRASVRCHTHVICQLAAPAKATVHSTPTPSTAPPRKSQQLHSLSAALFPRGVFVGALFRMLERRLQACATPAAVAPAPSSGCSSAAPGRGDGVPFLARTSSPLPHWGTRAQAATHAQTRMRISGGGRNWRPSRRCLPKPPREPRGQDPRRALRAPGGPAIIWWPRRGSKPSLPSSAQQRFLCLPCKGALLRMARCIASLQPSRSPKLCANNPVPLLCVLSSDAQRVGPPVGTARASSPPRFRRPSCLDTRRAPLAWSPTGPTVRGMCLLLLWKRCLAGSCCF